MSTVYEFMEKFVAGTLGKKTKEGRWSVKRDGDVESLVYQPTRNGKPILLFNNNFIGEKPVTELFAYRLPDGTALVNGNVLQHIGRGQSRWDGDAIIREHEWMEQFGAILIPFTLFEETETNVRDFALVVKPVAEHVHALESSMPWDHNAKPRHFSGACVFQIAGDHYLYDLDRKELEEHKIFNPFVVKLPKPVCSIEEAYDALMPDEVREALQNNTEITRQGEFFFIKHSSDYPLRKLLTDEERQILRYPPSRAGFGFEKLSSFVWLRDDTAPFEPEEELTEEMKLFQESALKYHDVVEKALRVCPHTISIGRNTTHTAEFGALDGQGVAFVSGRIVHSDRQHGTLHLDGWWKVVQNNAVASFTIQGNVD